MSALWIWAYLDTKNVPRCRANFSGLRICGEVFAKSTCFQCLWSTRVTTKLTVGNILDYSFEKVSIVHTETITTTVPTWISGYDHRIVRLGVANANIAFQERRDIVLDYVLYIGFSHDTEDAYLVFAVAGSGERGRHLEKSAMWYCFGRLRSLYQKSTGMVTEDDRWWIRLPLQINAETSTEEGGVHMFVCQLISGKDSRNGMSRCWITAYRTTPDVSDTNRICLTELDSR